MSFIRDSLCLKVDCPCRVIYVRTRMNEIEAMYEVSRLDVRVERVSTLTFLRDSSHIASIVFTHINFTVKLRDSGNPPLFRTRLILPRKNGPNNDKAKVIKGFTIPSFDMCCLSESFRVTQQAKGGNVVTYYTAMVKNRDTWTQGTVKFPSACSWTKKRNNSLLVSQQSWIKSWSSQMLNCH